MNYENENKIQKLMRFAQYEPERSGRTCRRGH